MSEAIEAELRLLTDPRELGRRFLTILAYVVATRGPKDDDTDYRAGWYDAINEFGTILVADPKMILRSFADAGDDEVAEALVSERAGDEIREILEGVDFTTPHPRTLARIAEALDEIDAEREAKT